MLALTDGVWKLAHPLVKKLAKQVIIKEARDDELDFDDLTRKMHKMELGDTTDTPDIAKLEEVNFTKQRFPAAFRYVVRAVRMCDKLIRQKP